MMTLFVTSSGTGIGKTHVCCRLIEELGKTRRLRVIKPVATGFDPDDLASSDTGRLLEALGLALDAEHVEATTPWRYAAPLSPDMAAAREGTAVPFERLVEFCRAADDYDLTIIEGIGGVMVPLDRERTVLDWIGALDPVVWLVVGSYLGSLSHSLTARAALESRGLEVGAVIVSESEDQPMEAAETAAVLERFMSPAPVRVLSRGPSPGPILAPLIEPRLAKPA